ncbi:MAG TPA: hypothetical protein VGF74_01070 [Thermoleophilaceae bacterium]
MRTVMVRYRVRPDRVAENEELVRAVYAELAEIQPDGLQYATFRLDDGVTFVHVAAHAADDNPLNRVAAFQRFLENIRDRCDEPPAAGDTSLIGSFKLFEERP